MSIPAIKSSRGRAAFLRTEAGVVVASVEVHQILNLQIDLLRGSKSTEADVVVASAGTYHQIPQKF